MNIRHLGWAILTGGLVGALLVAGTAGAKPGGLPQCLQELNTCSANLATCQTDLEACEAAPNAVFPGDGAGNGPALSYTDNGDGTATDNNTGLMWEVKDNAGGIHDVDNVYSWTSSVTGADGTAFTVFLATLNNKCDGDETTACTSNANCAGIGNGLCGHAGHRDWRIPNVKELQSIVDYGTSNPLTIDPSFPGLTAANFYWSSTPFAAFFPSGVWVVSFGNGIWVSDSKESVRNVRAVRGGS